MGMRDDFKDIDKFEEVLRRLSVRGIPRATRDTINSAAFETLRESRKTLSAEFTLRNRFTQGSVRVDKSKSLKISEQESEVGSVQRYLDRQETGFTQTKRWMGGIPIPTAAAAGQGNARNRTKPVRMQNRQGRLKGLRKSLEVGRGKSKKQRRAIVLSMAARGKLGKVIAMPLKTRDVGIFRVKISGRRSSKPKVTSVSMLYRLNKNQVRVAASPWLSPSTDTVVPKMGSMYRKALVRQLSFHRRQGRL